VFLTDQQRWDTTGVHGNPLGLTPNFDRVAAEGTHLQHSFSVQPLCGPSRSCLQTGLYPTRTGCYRNDIPLPEGTRTLAQLFGDHGYDTGYIGKWHLGSGEPVAAAERGGYRHWLAANLLEFSSGPYHTVLYDEDDRPVKLPGYRVDALTDAAIRYLDRKRSKPFFLFLSHLEPHQQNQVDDYPPPRGYRDRYQGAWLPPDLAALGGTSHRHIAGYYGMVRRLDEAFGRLLDAVESLGLRENTVVLFSSDHGCHFRTRNEEYKRSCHDASLRVPTCLTGPGFFEGGRVRALTTLLDLPPTLLEAAGIEPPAELDGRPVQSLRHLQRESWPDDVFFQLSESEVGRGIRTQRWKYAVSALDTDPFSQASKSYVESHLYDMEHDPYELENLAGYPSHAHVRSVLRERLFSRLRQVEGTRPIVESAPAVEQGYFRARSVSYAEAHK
jgi:arylsulfatase A-like enzyme